MRWAWAALLSACGAVTTVAHGGEASSWSAAPPTERVLCSVARRCERSASLRLVPPEDASLGEVRLDGAPVDAGELALGVCALPGSHALEVGVTDGTLAASIVVEDGTESVVDVDGAALRATTSVDDLDAYVGGLAAIALPAEGDAQALRTALLAWRARLSRVHDYAEATRDLLLRTAVDDHLARTDAIAAAIDRGPAAARAAIEEETRAASAMYAVEHLCDVWAPSVPELLPALTVEVRPVRSFRFRFERVRAAIDGVEVLDTTTFQRAPFATGLVPPGDHRVVVEAELRGSGLFLFEGRTRWVVRVERPFTVGRQHGARIVVHLGDRGGIITEPTAIDVLRADVEIGALPAMP